jgi:hypothetical protein
MRVRFAIFALAILCSAQASLNNDAIVKMVKSGLGETAVISAIKSQPGQYATSADDLIALKKAGVPDRIINAMIDKATAPAPAVSAAPAAPPPAKSGELPPPVVPETGVYYNKSGAWADLFTEIVNTKSGGLKKIVGKGELTGHINGLHSPNQLPSPVELLVYAEEGVAITEYRLVRLHEQKDAREFRTSADTLPFESKKFAPRTWVIVLSAIGPGEYGLLGPQPARISSFCVAP